MSLTKQDLTAIQTIVDNSIDQKLNEKLKSHLKLIKKDIKKLQKTLDVTTIYFDRVISDLNHRVIRIEDKLHLSSI